MNCIHCHTALVAGSNLCPNNACGRMNIQMPGQQISFVPPPPLQYGPLTQPQPTPQPNNAQPQLPTQPTLVVQQQPVAQKNNWGLWAAIAGLVLFIMVLVGSMIGWHLISGAINGVKEEVKAAAVTVNTNATDNAHGLHQVLQDNGTKLDGVKSANEATTAAVKVSNERLSAIDKGVDALGTVVSNAADTAHKDSLEVGAKLDTLDKSVQAGNAHLKAMSWQLSAQRREAQAAFAEAKAAAKAAQAENSVAKVKVDNKPEGTDE